MSRLGPALLLALTACAVKPPPEVYAVEPASTVYGVAVDVTIHGLQLAPRVQMDFDRPSQSVVDQAFQAWLGDAPLEGVTWVDGANLQARVPATLLVGVYPLRVRDPRGREVVLEAAFTVVPQPGQLLLKIETQSGGQGQEVGDVQVRAGTPVQLFAVRRDADGGFAGDVPNATWTVQGAGVLTATTGSSVSWVSQAPGEAVVGAASGSLAPDVTGTLRAAACQQDLDCVTACSSQARCVASVCEPGASTKDSDNDGQVDQACLGGTDCDDSDPLVRPGAVEGPDGDATCSDQKDNDCDGAVDLQDPFCAPNAPPQARLTLSPVVALAGDPVTGSGAASTDREEPASALTYAWDWDNDGVFEATGQTSNHAFGVAGTYPVTLKVTDSAGAYGTAVAVAVVAVASGDLATVTTGVDEANAGATPANPQGAGFSLREAVAWAAATPGAQVVLVPAGTTVALTSQLNFPDGQALTVVGRGAILDGTAIPGAGSSCLDIAGQFKTLVGLEIRNCPGWPLYVTGANNAVQECSIHDNAYGASWYGTPGLFGPGNVVFANRFYGLSLGAPAEARDNVIHSQVTGPGVVLYSAADGSLLVGNVIRDNPLGITINTQCDGVRVLHNTVHGNGGAGVSWPNNTSGHDVRNNVFSSNAGWGLDGLGTGLATVDANDFFQNGSGACRSCATLGPASQAVDPGYVDLAARDLRLLRTSPLRNAGVDTGQDRNGAAAGNFNGAAPDVGAFESN